LRFRWITIALLGGVLLLLWPQQAAAQADAITWEVTPGFNGVYRAGAWFPIKVTLSNSGPDVRGALELRILTGQSSTFSQTVELPHNAKKQLVLPVASRPDQSGALNAELTLRSGNTVVRQERIKLNGHDSFVRIIGVISDQGGALPELANMIPPDNGSGALLRLSGADLPDRAELLQSFNVLFVHAVDTSLWSDAQRTAIRDWVGNGGQLVIGGDPVAARGLGDLLPATFEETGQTSSLQGLSVGTSWPVRADAPAVPVLRLTPAPDAEVVLRGDNDLPLLVRRWSGLGLVAMSSFGLERLRDAGDAARFWPTVLWLQGDPAWGWVDLRQRGRGILEQAIELPGLRLPSPLAMFGFLLLYIVTIGPLNYLLLRRLQRREWAYITIPLLVLLFSGGAYAWGTIGRGGAASVTELSIVSVLADPTRGQATTFLALFSPTRRSYDVQADPEALVSNLEEPWSRSGGDVDVVFGEGDVRVPQLLVDVGGVRTLAADHLVDVPQFEARRTGANEITVRNGSAQPIEDIVLISGQGSTQTLGALDPGQERSVTFDEQPSAFPSLSNGANGTLNRETIFQQISGTLFSASSTNVMPPLPVGADGVMVAPALPPPLPPNGAVSATLPRPEDQLYVLGWQSQAALPVTLNSQQTSAAGETLYIWPVSKEQ
jgi:hypothetical protein